MMKQMKKVLVGCFAFTLLFSQGLAYVEAKDVHEKKNHPKTKIIDKNKDGIPDKWELKYKLGLGKEVAKKDNDKDGLNNLIEYKLNLNPTSNDTDKDAISDGDEDSDRDGLCNTAEIELGTKMEDPDSDNDNIKDGLEVQGKDKIKLSDKIQVLEMKIKTADKKHIKVNYHFHKNLYFVKIKDQTGTVTKEMIDSLINDLQASPQLTAKEIVSKVQTLFHLETPFHLEMELKYFNGRKIEIEKKQHQKDDSKQDKGEYGENHQTDDSKQDKDEHGENDEDNE